MDADPLRLAFLADPNSIHTRRWIGWFAARGHEVHLLVPEGGAVLAGLPASIVVARYQPYGRGRGPLRGAFRARRSLRAALDAIKPQIIHAHYVTTSGWSAWLAGRHPLVVTAWGSDIYVNTKPLNGKVMSRAILRSADLVTADSRDLLNACVRAGARRDRVRLVQFGVDRGRFHPGVDATAFRARAEAGDRRILLSPRRITPLYRQDVVLEAVAALPPDVLAVFSAQGADARELSRMRDRAAELEILDRILVLPGFDHAEMPAAYAAADVVVSVPSSDGTPVTLLEALAAGRPVVATDLPSVREWLGDVDPGALVPVGDAAATAEAIRTRLAWTPDERAAHEAKAVALVAERGDEDASLGAMELEYRRLAGLR